MTVTAKPTSIQTVEDIFMDHLENLAGPVVVAETGFLDPMLEKELL